MSDTDRVTELEAEVRRLRNERTLGDHIKRLEFIERRLSFWFGEDFRGPLFEREYRGFICGQSHEAGMAEAFEGLSLADTVSAVRLLTTPTREETT